VTCSLGVDGVATPLDTCSYTCDTVYVRLSGDAMRTCNNDGSWSGSAAVCGTGNTVNKKPSPEDASFKIQNKKGMAT